MSYNGPGIGLVVRFRLYRSLLFCTSAGIIYLNIHKQILHSFQMINFGSFIGVKICKYRY